ncbi:MAG TPA: TetR/AcrR family transcriptional regulator [Polyangia bacterium]|nr:TetR/AcrR family transcriptional regulator [Polyangia bacterium]
MARPRQFDEETALDAALQLFWQKGYVNTSVDDLLTAMGVNRWSMYNTFGDKEALFLKALERYALMWRRQIAQLVTSEPSPRARARRLLDALFEQVRSDSRAWGCLIANSAFEYAQIPESAQKIVKRSLASREKILADAVAQAQDTGELPVAGAPHAIAQTLLAALNGARAAWKLQRSKPAVDGVRELLSSFI